MQGASGRTKAAKPSRRRQADHRRVAEEMNTMATTRTSNDRRSYARAAPGHSAAAGDRKGHAPLDAAQRLRVRGQSPGDEGRRARAVEELFDVKVVKVAHAEPQGQAAPHAVPQRIHEGLEEGDREARRRASDRLLLSNDSRDRHRRSGINRRTRERMRLLKDNDMGIRRYKPTTPGRRGATVSDFAELTPGAKPEKSLLRAQEARPAAATTRA